MKEQRKKIWIDRFQTLLIVRIAAYFLVYQVFVWAVFAVEESIGQALRINGLQDRSLRLMFFREAILLSVGALFIWDAVKFAHRVVGPIYRFRSVVKTINAGDDVPLVVLRKGDLLIEFQDDFNEMLTTLEQRGAIVIKRNQPRVEQDKPVAVA
jgi:nitrogen fixation/metabolism regulation signal transduction histidine kinase